MWDSDLVEEAKSVRDGFGRSIRQIVEESAESRSIEDGRVGTLAQVLYDTCVQPMSCT